MAAKLYGLGLALITVLTACDSDEDDNPDRNLSTSLAPRAGWQSISGTAAVSWRAGAGQFVASAELAGDAVGASRPWHVHFGNCASGGGIVGDGYAPLVIDQDGAAQSMATIQHDLDSGAPYHVNVHESAAALETIVACGDLTARIDDDDRDDDKGDDGGDDTGEGSRY